MRKIADITKTFLNNVQAARVFTAEIARHADVYDVSAWLRTVEEMLRLAGIPEASLEELRQKLDELTAKLPVDPPQMSASEVKATFERFDHSMTTLLANTLENEPEKSFELTRIAERGRKAATRQGKLLRQASLTLLVSFVESLVSELVQAFYLRYPEALPADAATLTLADLRYIGSVEDAERLITTKEAEKLLRESLDTQLKFFVSRGKLPLIDFPDYVERVTEVIQRRNVIVHNNAVINRVYLEKVSDVLLKKYDAKEGDVLPMTPEYIASAVSSVASLGTLLALWCWLKWENSDAEALDSFVVALTYENLVDGQYDEVLELARIANVLGIKSDASRRVITVNKATALRALGHVDDAVRVIVSLDWSATSSRFLCVVAAIRGSENEFFEIAEKCSSTGEVHAHEFAEWPVLKPFRGSPRFEELLRQARSHGRKPSSSDGS